MTDLCLALSLQHVGPEQSLLGQALIRMGKMIVTEEEGVRTSENLNHRRILTRLV